MDMAQKTEIQESVSRWRRSLVLGGFAAGLLAPMGVWAAESAAFPPEQIEFFENKIRPVLAESCLDCHTGIKAKNGLRLDSRAGIMKGSDYRKVVNLEKPAESALILAVKHVGGAAKIPSMPEKGAKLSAEAVADLEQWIGMGLPWPADKAGDLTGGGGDTASKHWAFQPVVKPALPEGYTGNPIDFFINRQLSAAGLEPAPTADRATLYRRAHFSLLGLPPTFADQSGFVGDSKPDAEAWGGVLDRLLASPHYGERWARHWMDVARYSDTKGYEAGGRERRFIFSYTYRDWLIRAFNEDLPYDQFLLYQLAAEQLVDRNDAAKRGHLAALGFLTLSKNGAQEEIFADRIDTTFRGLQALTVGCARCHDHKSDPIGTKEYYGFYGIFLNSVEPESAPEIGQPRKGPEYDAYLKQLAEKQKVVDDFLQPKLAELGKQHPEIANRPAALIGKLPREDRRKLDDLEKVVDKFVADSGMEPDRALILEDREKPISQDVFIRGNSGRRGELAPRKFLDILTGGAAPEYQKGSGRLELARSIADPANPLTARVIVNRVWSWHFGEGLVRTVSDFGIEGDRPSHPELLDWLASWFVENGWSIKKLHRLILTSETWRRASAHPAASDPERAARFASVDPENRLYWRQNRQRLDFEQMHDSLLQVAGNLKGDLYGRSVTLLQPPFANRRAVYAYIDRQNVDPTFRNFDFSNPQEHTGKRPRTSIPMQALFLLNGPFVQEQADRLLKRPEIVSSATPEDKVAALYRAALSREPDAEEARLALGFIRQAGETLGSIGDRQTMTEWEYGYGGIDPESAAVSFQRYPVFDGEGWQVAGNYPGPDGPAKYLRVRRDGSGHTGSDARHAWILRWTAPRDTTIQITGSLTRGQGNVGKGDGVVARIVQSGKGVVLSRDVPAASTGESIALPSLAVRAGDRLDFVVEPGANGSFDSFSWSPEIRDASNSAIRWNFTSQFGGPAELSDAWENLAQALLGTNEFLFVD
ncbi:MAG: PSD1 domain-containing protein [Verrucomicrobiales bacterium]|nr:PSD1 domain-containing protein [Verrucomicrobiales bacterium]